MVMAIQRYAQGLTEPLVLLLNQPDVIAESIKSHGFSKIGLLGTRFTMEKDFYKEKLEEHGMIFLINEKWEAAYFIWHSFG